MTTALERLRAKKAAAANTGKAVKPAKKVEVEEELDDEEE